MPQLEGTGGISGQGRTTITWASGHRCSLLSGSVGEAGKGGHIRPYPSFPFLRGPKLSLLLPSPPS